MGTAFSFAGQVLFSAKHHAVLLLHSVLTKTAHPGCCTVGTTSYDMMTLLSTEVQTDNIRTVRNVGAAVLNIPSSHGVDWMTSDERRSGMNLWWCRVTQLSVRHYSNGSKRLAYIQLRVTAELYDYLITSYISIVLEGQSICHSNLLVAVHTHWWNLAH